MAPAPPDLTPPPGPASDAAAAVLRSYELPTARGVVYDGLALATSASAELRRASLYIGLLLLGLLGPAVALGLAIIGRFGIDSFLDFAKIGPSGPSIDPAFAGPLVVLVSLLTIGVLGLLAIGFDALIVAIAIIGGQAAAAPLSLSEAVLRARQTFWRVVRAALLLGFGSNVLIEVLASLLPGLQVQEQEAGGLVLTAVSTLVFAPFGFYQTGIVLGDVGAREALRRSIRLARTRPQLALVVAAFSFVGAGLQVFGLAAGADILARVAVVLHLGLSSGPIGALLTAVLAGLAVTALGSLLFTVSAMVAAPQVAAFLGLTFYSTGLDRARLATRPPGFRLVSTPMKVAIVLLCVGAAIGIAELA